MDNGGIVVEHSLAEQHPHDDNQQRENTAQNQSSKAPIGNNIKMAKKGPMNPTPLEFSCWSTHRTTRTVVITALFVCLVMVVGIMIVCLAPEAPRPPICVPMLHSTVRYSDVESSHPRSIAVGDFNNDRHMDLVVANSELDNAGVFLGYGDSTFGTQISYSTGAGSAPRMVAVGDFNNDSRLDVVVANFGTNSIGILFGNVDGNFTNQATIDTVPSRPLYLAVADFNNDQHLDIAFVGYGTNVVGIVLGFGNGTFRTPKTFSTAYDSLPYSLAVGDFNKDKKLDIAVANSGTDNLGIFLGYGDGTFANQISYATAVKSHPYSVAISDLNHDTYVDIVMANSNANNLGILFGYENGSFSSPIYHSTGAKSNPIYVAIADLNSDNKPDIVLANNGTDMLVILFGNGDGTFANQLTYLTGFRSSPSSIVVADFNHDNQSDIAVVNQQSNNVKIFDGYSNETFASQISYPSNNKSDPSGIFVASTGVGSYPRWIVHSDFNSDGTLDVAVADYSANSVGILLGSGNDTFLPIVTYSTGDDSHPWSLALGDFNSDGQIDIAVAKLMTSNIGVFLGYGNGTFSSQINSWTGYEYKPHSIAVGDLNNDGVLDIVGTSVPQSIIILLGYDNGSFSIQKVYSTGDSSIPNMVVLGDLNNDSWLDIVVANYGANNVGVFLAYGNAEFASQSVYPTGDYSFPAAISLGDFNSDSRLDIAVVNCGTGTIGVLLGHSDGTFLPQITYPMGSNSSPQSISLGDINDDGVLDMVVANTYAHNVGVLLGYGNGTFSFQVIYPVGDESTFPLFVDNGDFNNDGQLDIAVSILGLTSVIDILLGNGDGSFNPPIIYSTGNASDPRSVAVGDFNNDDRLDIAVANSGTNNVGVLLAYGNGTFLPQITSSTGSGSSPVSIAVADFNNDDRLDIAVANSGTNNIGILLGHADGTFSPQITFPTGPESLPSSIVVGDFNNDDELDIAVANYVANNVGIFLGYGNGSFSSQITSPTGFGSGSWSVATGDFNNDGQLDIVVANSYTNNIGILLGQGDGNFESQMTYYTGNGSIPNSVAVGDFNDDGQLDIAVGDFGTSNLCIFLGYRDGTLTLYSIYSLVNGSTPNSITVGDFNNDGQLDIAVINYPTNNVGILLGQGDGNFQSERIYSLGDICCPLSIAVGDFNKDGELDIAVVIDGASSVTVLLGQGNGTFPCIKCVDSFPSSVAIGDFNNDNRLDIIVTNSATDNVGILLGNGNGSFERQMTYSTGKNSHPVSVAVGDFNGDSRLDIAVSNFEAGNVGCLLGYGNGKFSSQSTYSTGDNSNPGSIAVGNFNNDSRLDIVVAIVNTNSIGIFLGYGDGNFSSQVINLTGNNPYRLTLVVADFNHDDRLDIAVANYITSNISILLGYGNGTFGPQTTFSTGVYTRPAALATGDFNNDSNLDIAVLNTNTDEAHVLILLRNGNGSFSSHRRYLTEPGSQPSAIVVGHFNDDNQLDIAVANNVTSNVEIFLGYGDGTFSNQTTYSTGDGSYPVSIAMGDFNDDNQIDLVVANYGASTVGIFLAFRNTTFVERATLSTGSAALSQTIALGDFTNDGQLDIVIGNGGTHDIGMLVSEGNESFIIQTAYSAASSFFPECIIATDFNNDNRLDIAVINSATGTIDLLFGNGNGTFGNYTTYSTGTGFNPQSIAIGDFNNDNREDIVFADSDTRSVGILFKIDNGALKKMRTFSTGSGSKPHGLAVGDFDNDGRLDVAVANNGNANIGFFFGFENGTFSSQKTVPVKANTYPAWTGVGDFNNDNQLDVVVINNISPSPIIVLLGNGNGSFEIEITDGIVPGVAAAIGDFNGDDQLDLILCQSFKSGITVLIGYGNGTFVDLATYPTGDTSYSVSITIGDFNNDKRLDVAVANSYAENVGILLGDGAGRFSPERIYYTGDSTCPFLITVADLNNDNQLDIAVIDGCTYTIVVLFGYGDGTFSAPTMHPMGDGILPVWIYAADFNNDGRLDIGVTHYDTGHLGIFLGHGNGTFFNEIIYTTGDNSGSYSIGVGDLNNDDRLDIIVSNMWTENIGVFLGYASENFVSATAYSIGGSSRPVSIAVGDFDNDIHLDVVVADQATNKIILLHGSGQGTFSNPNSYLTGDGSHPIWVAVGDFNQDHQLDVAVVNSGTTNIGILLGNGDGTFSSLKTYSTGESSSPLSLAVGHFDNDTYLDIAVANFGSGNIYLFLGYGNGSFDSPSFFTSRFGSHPSAVAFGDMNGDNSGDVVICDNGFSTIEILSMTCSP